jgi:hypothetical protein
MSERDDIIDLVNAVFDTVDAKDWDAVERLFTDTVDVDFTSLGGGEPATMPKAALVDSWRQGLHAGKQSFHFVGHHRITLGGDAASVAVKGYAYNVLADEYGGGMWEVWGDYTIPVRRGENGWLAAGLTFRAWHTRGDEAVRAHTLG